MTLYRYVTIDFFSGTSMVEPLVQGLCGRQLKVWSTGAVLKLLCVPAVCSNPEGMGHAATRWNVRRTCAAMFQFVACQSL